MEGEGIMRFVKRKKVFFAAVAVTCLVAVDIVTSRNNAGNDPVVDSYFYDSGENDDYDGVTGASIKTHVSIIKASNPLLSFSKGDTADLTPAEVREMVFKALAGDRHFGTLIPELKYKIDGKGAGCWVAIMPNIVYCPGQKYMPGDQTDPRIIQAVLDYIADSTGAQRISLLAGGGYAGYGEFDIFELAQFGSYTWADFFPGLHSDFTLGSIADSARVRHPGKIIDCINLNFNEIMSDGRPYNEIPDSERAGMAPQIYPVPDNNQIGLGALTTANTTADNGYVPCDAVLNCDILVNVPVLKTTFNDHLVLNCVHKNYIGSVSRGVYAVGDTYPRPRVNSLSLLDHDELVETVLNLFAYHPTDYCVIDGIASLEGDGSHPNGRSTGFLRRNFIMTGGDPVAVEAVACATININPMDLDLLRWEHAKGTGTMFLDQIAVIGDSIGSVRTDFMAPIGRAGNYTDFHSMHYYGRGCRRWLLLGPFNASTNDSEAIAETDANPMAGDQEDGKTWTEYISPSDYVDLTVADQNTATNSIIYAFSRIYSKTAQSGMLYAGGVRDIKIYINGEALTNASYLTYDRVSSFPVVNLQQGDNRILVKMRRSGSEYGFSLAVVNIGGLTERNGYVPHSSSSWTLGTPDTFTAAQKMSYFGGRTLWGTFYHLGSDVAVEKAGVAQGTKMILASSPNPFNSTVKISFTLPKSNAPVLLGIYDASGRKVADIYKSRRAASRQAVLWHGTDANGKEVMSGVYFACLKANNAVLTRQLIYLK